MNYKKAGHSVHYLTYHVIFVTKYRRKVITNEIGDYMKELSEYICGRFNGDALSIETDEDHIHLLIQMPPDVNMSVVINTLKAYISKNVHDHDTYGPQIRKQLYENAPLWSPSYFIATTGSVSIDVVKQYIEGQRTDEHKRKYIKSGKYKKHRS